MCSYAYSNIEIHHLNFSSRNMVLILDWWIFTKYCYFQGQLSYCHKICVSHHLCLLDFHIMVFFIETTGPNFTFLVLHIVCIFSSSWKFNIAASVSENKTILYAILSRSQLKWSGNKNYRILLESSLHSKNILGQSVFQYDPHHKRH